MQVQLGDEAHDTITGFSGVVTGRCTYITGCDQALLAPPMKDDGTWREPRWFDVDRLTVDRQGAVKITVRTPGADVPAPAK